jgi:hypothetical protein
MPKEIPEGNHDRKRAASRLPELRVAKQASRRWDGEPLPLRGERLRAARWLCGIRTPRPGDRERGRGGKRESPIALRLPSTPLCAGAGFGMEFASIKVKRV